MKKTIEVVAKKVNDAIEDGLRQLGVTLDEVEVKVIEQGGLFKKAKVELTVEIPDPKPEKTEKEFKKPAEEIKPAKAKQAAEKETKKIENVAEKSEKTKQSEIADEKPENKADENKNAQPKKPKKKFEEKPREKVEVKEEHIKKCEEFLSGLISKMGVDGKVVIKENDGIEAVIETEDSAVIGYRGEVLDSLQYLTSLALNEIGGKHIRFSLDALGYRARREETLKRLAEKTAAKCIKNNRKVSLEPMNSAERRVIHSALGDNEKVITRSEGHEPNRRVVVLPRK